jgi:hypothetical protein
MKAVEASEGRRISPSQLARKILCKAYLPEKFPSGLTGLRLRWRHSDEMIGVLRLLFAEGSCVLGVEVPTNGGRVDIVARASDQRKIAVEVKSHRGDFRELDKIQAALYWSPQFDCVAVANRHGISIMSPQFVQEVRTLANITRECLGKQPQLAAVSFTPHPDVCATCQNLRCPYLSANIAHTLRVNMSYRSLKQTPQLGHYLPP